ncbi:hypothetical protein PSHT_11652 [Puccinia striiformis]|uniref:Uncharacterized protein n=1 Tax=Puccinia striiformis TaxID=27350 RepID=A0A2S4V225_9BASI|nr:hypothetical protein PSHT_11652 [Puccinia striiformis]
MERDRQSKSQAGGLCETHFLHGRQPVKWSTHHSKICRARRKSGQQASDLLGEDSLYPMYHAMSKRVKNTLMKQCNATLLSLQQSCILVSECTYLDAHLDHVARKPPKPYNCFDVNSYTQRRT